MSTPRVVVFAVTPSGLGCFSVPLRAWPRFRDGTAATWELFSAEVQGSLHSEGGSVADATEPLNIPPPGEHLTYRARGARD